MAKKKSKERTDQQVVDQTNELARLFYKSHGYVVPEGYRFDQATHPHEHGMWILACIAQEELMLTDPNDALCGIEY